MRACSVCSLTDACEMHPCSNPCRMPASRSGAYPRSSAVTISVRRRGTGDTSADAMRPVRERMSVGEQGAIGQPPRMPASSVIGPDLFQCFASSRSVAVDVQPLPSVGRVPFVERRRAPGQLRPPPTAAWSIFQRGQTQGVVGAREHGCSSTLSWLPLDAVRCRAGRPCPPRASRECRTPAVARVVVWLSRLGIGPHGAAASALQLNTSTWL